MVEFPSGSSSVFGFRVGWLAGLFVVLAQSRIGRERKADRERERMGKGGGRATHGGGGKTRKKRN